MYWLCHGLVQYVDTDGVVPKVSQLCRQAAGVVPLVLGPCLVQCEVAYQRVPVQSPGVNHYSSPHSILIEHHHPLLTPPVIHPLHAGIMQGSPHHLTLQADLTALMVVEISQGAIVTVVDPEVWPDYVQVGPDHLGWVGGQLAVVEPCVLHPHPGHPQPVIVWVLKVQRKSCIRAVGLEANREKDEGHVRDRDGEPGDQLVLQGRHVAGEQGLHGAEVR